MNYDGAEDFQQAYAEIQTTTDPMRYAYLKWIGYHMWKRFDYESGLKMINSETEYRRFKREVGRGLVADGNQGIKERDATGEPVTFPLKSGLFSKS